jgi:ribosomal protein S18 acetylase RimI-like enzyme
MPPGKNMDDWFTIFRSGLWRLYYKLSREGKARFYGEFLPLLHRTKEEVLQDRDDQSMYLVYIGSKPSARGKGYARALIEHGLAMVSIQLILIHVSGKSHGRMPTITLETR